MNTVTQSKSTKTSGRRGRKPAKDTVKEEVKKKVVTGDTLEEVVVEDAEEATEEVAEEESAAEPTVVEAQIIEIPNVEEDESSSSENSFENFKIPLTDEQREEAMEMAEEMDITTLDPIAITEIGSEIDVRLSDVLGKVLNDVKNNDDPRLFNLVAHMNTELEGENIPDAVDRILHEKPTLMLRAKGAVGRFFSKKGFEELTGRALAMAKAESLESLIEKSEDEFKEGQTSLQNRLKMMQGTMSEYREVFKDHAVCVAAVQIAYKKAKRHIAEFKETMDPNNSDDLDMLQTLESNLELLERQGISRVAGAMELKQAAATLRDTVKVGITTYNESKVVAKQQISNMKLTVASLVVSNQTNRLQEIHETGAKTQENLSLARGHLHKKTAIVAAEAPGKNLERRVKLITLDATQLEKARIETEKGRETSDKKTKESIKALTEIGERIIT